MPWQIDIADEQVEPLEIRYRQGSRSKNKASRQVRRARHDTGSHRPGRASFDNPRNEHRQLPSPRRLRPKVQTRATVGARDNQGRRSRQNRLTPATIKTIAKPCRKVLAKRKASAHHVSSRPPPIIQIVAQQSNRVHRKTWGRSALIWRKMLVSVRSRCSVPMIQPDAAIEQTGSPTLQVRLCG